MPSFKTREELADALSTDTEFQQLSDQEQHQLFTSLSQELGFSSLSPSAQPTLSAPRPLTAGEFTTQDRSQPFPQFDPFKTIGAAVNVLPAQARRFSEGRPLLPLGQAFTTELRGGELTPPGQEREAGAMRFLTGQLPFLMLGARTPIGREIGATAEEMIGTARLPSLPKLPLSRQSTVKTLQQIRQAFLQAPKIASAEWESAMEEVDRLHPDLQVDASDPFVRLKVSGQENPSVLPVLHRAARRVGRAEKKTGISELLTRVLDNPAEAQSLTRQETANLKSVFQEALKPQFNRFVPELDDTEVELMDAYHGIRHAQIDQVPGYEDIAKKYGDTLEKFRTLKPKFKMGALYNNILGDFRDPELAETAEQLLPHDAIGMMNQLRAARNVKRGAGIAGITAAGYLTTKTPLGRTFLEMIGLRSRE